MGFETHAMQKTALFNVMAKCNTIEEAILELKSGMDREDIAAVEQLVKEHRELHKNENKKDA